MLLEKVSIHTEIIFVDCYKILLLSLVLFSVFVEHCILLPKGINELNIVEILLQSAFSFSYKKVTSKSFNRSKIHPVLLMLMQRNEI
jgi:hypothetical protein